MFSASNIKQIWFKDIKYVFIFRNWKILLCVSRPVSTCTSSGSHLGKFARGFNLALVFEAVQSRPMTTKLAWLSVFETQSKKLQVLMPWNANHRHEIEEKSTKSSWSSSKVFGLGLADLWEFPTQMTIQNNILEVLPDRFVSPVLQSGDIQNYDVNKHDKCQVWIWESFPHEYQHHLGPRMDNIVSKAYQT